MHDLAHRARRRCLDESGQLMPLLAAGLLVILLGMAALVVDYGRSLAVKRELQSAVDLAALAAARQLPDSSAASTVAATYGALGLNPPVGAVAGSIRQDAPSTFCTHTVGTCTSPDSLTVTASADVEPMFAKVLGIDALHVSAKAAACGPCTPVKADVMIVLDRTLSMCMDDNPSPNVQLRNGQNVSLNTFIANPMAYLDSNGNFRLNVSSVKSQNDCPDFQNAKEGIETFLSYLDPNLVHVGLVVTPPALDPAHHCTSAAALVGYEEYGEYPSYGSWRSFTDGAGNYVIDGLSQGTNYTQLISDIDNCIQVGGSTAYADALTMANTALSGTGSRADAKKFIVLVSDGGANSANARLYPNPADPTQAPPRGSSWNNAILKPCQAGLDAATNIKAAHVAIYTIGYDVATAADGSITSDMQCYQAPHGGVDFVGYHDGTEQPERGADGTIITADAALRGIAGAPPDADDATRAKQYYYRQPTPDDLKKIFTQIAIAITNAKLIPVPPS